MKKSALNNLSYGLFLALLVFTPLAFGTVENWSLLVMETLAGAAFLLLIISGTGTKKKYPALPGVLPLLLLPGLLLLQLIPLPAQLVRFLSPGTFEVYRPLLETGSGFIPLSLNPGSTLLSFCTLVSFSLVYILTIYHLGSGERLKKTAAVVTVLGAGIAVEAILQKLTAPDTIYWLRTAPANATPVGPWVYSNHFAGFMEMIFPLTIALFLFYRPQNHYDTQFRDKVITLFTMPGANRYLLLATAAVLMAVSILLSLSRGGIVTLCVAFLFFTVFASRATRDRRVQWAVLITVSVVLIFTWLGWQPIIEEFGKLWGIEGLNAGGRLPVYLDTLEIIRTFPLLGTGAGTFIHVYPAFRSISGNAIFDHAHNDYLEILSESGIAGFLLSSWFVLAVFLHTVGRLMQRRDRYSILLASASLTGMLALLFHSLVDFQMYNGANGLYFFFLCGLAVSGANTRIRFRSRQTLLRETESRLLLVIPCIFAVILLAGSSFFRIGSMRAQKTYAPVRMTYVNPNIPAAVLADMHRATTEAWRMDPLEAFYPYRLGRLSVLLGEQDRALREYLAAARLNPMAGAYVQQLALVLPGEQSDRADELLAAGIRREPLTADRYLLYSDWLLQHNQPDRSFDILQEAVTEVPAAMDDLARHIRDRNFTRDEIARILPPAPHAWYAMGKMFEAALQQEAAESYYLKALDFLDNGDIRRDYFTRLHALYRKQEEDGKALAIVRLGMDYLPDDPWFRIQLGNYYLSRGIVYRAVEEFRAALRLDPGNRSLARKLWKIEREPGGT